jgi:hypothetical protein
VGLSVRQRKLGVAMCLAGAGAVLAGLLVGRLPRQWPLALTAPIAVTCPAAAFIGLRPWWRALDHMQKDSRLRCWYWGGSLGGGVALLLAAVGSGVRSPFFAGAVLVWLLQFAGYAAERCLWWLAHRSVEA